MINILIRTSSRPNSFKRCLNSIRTQTYKSINIIVSADNKETVEYVKKTGITPIEVVPIKKSKRNTAPWNIYLNYLLAEVRTDWVMILDDDDYFKDNSSLAAIAKHLHNKSTLYIWRMAWPTGRIIPEDDYMNKLPVTRKHIGMPCFCFHVKYRPFIKFDTGKAADYRIIKYLCTIIPKVKWINQVFITIGNTGLKGEKKDI